MRRSRSIVALAVVLGLPALAPTGSAAPPRGTTPEARIAYIRDGDLWTVLPTGADDVRITSGPSRDTDPAWEPGTGRLAFTRTTSTGPQIWIVDTTGGSPQRLMNHASDPTWSPDGSSIAFVRRTRGNTDIWTTDVAGSNVRRLTNSPAADVEPAWGPSKIAFVSSRGGRPSIWVMAPSGRGERRLTEGKGRDRSPAWVDLEGSTAVILHEHVEAGGDLDLRTVALADGSLTPILVRDELDQMPSSASLPWFAFLRRTQSTTSIRTAELDTPLSTMRIIVSGSGLSDPAVAPAIA